MARIAYLFGHFPVGMLTRGTGPTNTLPVGMSLQDAVYWKWKVRQLTLTVTCAGSVTAAPPPYAGSSFVPASISFSGVFTATYDQVLRDGAEMTSERGLLLPSGFLGAPSATTLPADSSVTASPAPASVTMQNDIGATVFALSEYGTPAVIYDPAAGLYYPAMAVGGSVNIYANYTSTGGPYANFLTITATTTPSSGDDVPSFDVPVTFGTYSFSLYGSAYSNLGVPTDLSVSIDMAMAAEWPYAD